ncbi:rppH [Scenedesmus sp. PABB004]|nr:rppH [Scenedesmus sp. PABB004]
MAAVDAALQLALVNQQWDRVAPLLDAAELESGNPDVLNEWPHALHVLGLIYNQQLEDARFLWKRLPAEVKRDNAELNAVWRLLQYYWNKQYAGIWQALQGYQWSGQVRPFVDALVAKTRAEMLALLSESYSLVSPAKAAQLLGVSEGEVGHLVEGAGWRHDMESGCYAPAAPAPDDPDLDGFNALQQLAQYMPVPLLPEELADYRPNVGVCVVNSAGLVFAAQRTKDTGRKAAWQMPQGGIDPHETSALAAALRELKEETSITSVEVVAELPRWLTYDFPPDVRSRLWGEWAHFKGQAQRWFLLRFTGDDAEVDLNTEHREFRAWRWAPLEELPGAVIGFKRAVYEEVAAEFGPRVAAIAAEAAETRRAAAS